MPFENNPATGSPGLTLEQPRDGDRKQARRTMNTLSLLPGEGQGLELPLLQRRALVAKLAALVDAEHQSLRSMRLLTERMPAGSPRARLSILTVFCRAHSARLRGRIEQMQLGAVPLPADAGDAFSAFVPLESALRIEAGWARTVADRYDIVGEFARGQGDISSAWLCELGRQEELERAQGLDDVRRMLFGGDA